jgi:hypothetical protein
LLRMVVSLLTVSLVSCGSGSTQFSASAVSTRTLTALTTTVSTITGYFENPLTNQVGSSACNNDYTGSGTNCTSFTQACSRVSESTSSCQSARTALGLSGNWLSFSCNVVLGCTDSSKNAMSTCTGATYVSVTTQSLPDYASAYYASSGTYNFTANGESVTGSFGSLRNSYSTAFSDPGYIGAQNKTMYIPITPTQCVAGGAITCNSGSASSNVMAMGAAGVAINGIFIYSNVANGTDNIFAEAGSFDQCQGHPAGTQYHYHNEPPSISYNDDSLIGVMMDGYWIYGRKDSDGTIPGSLANEELGDSASDNTIYYFGGHVGAPPTGGNNVFHYHATEWIGCYDETSGGTSGFYFTDDGVTFDTFNSATFASGTGPAAPPGGNTYCKGTWVDAWFLTGHGNGGVFQTPADIGSAGGTGTEGSPVWTSSTAVLTSTSSVVAASPQTCGGVGATGCLSQTTAAIRYYYGLPGSCPGC